MLIKGEKISKVEIEINSLEQKRIVLNYIYQNFNWGKDFFIKENKLTKTLSVYNIIYYDSGSRNWEEEVFIRKATEQDIMTNSFVEAIKYKIL